MAIAPAAPVVSRALPILKAAPITNNTDHSILRKARTEEQQPVKSITTEAKIAALSILNKPKDASTTIDAKITIARGAFSWRRGSESGIPLTR